MPYHPLRSHYDLNTQARTESSLMRRLNYFLALSRTPHALIDLASPALAALFCLGSVPSWHIVFVGFITAFAGYTAVYSLNDIVDFRVDLQGRHNDTTERTVQDLDGLFVRHPLAKGLIPYGQAVVWALFWATLALIGAWSLNPFCLVIFICAAFLEVVYCFLLKITWLRSIVSGFVKSSGPVAAVFAVNADPPGLFLLQMFLFFFFWEIGGQNVPNDLSDLEGDRKLGAKTIPVRFGIRTSVRIIVFSLCMTYGLGFVLFSMFPAPFSGFLLAAAGVCGFFLLLLPAIRLYRSQETDRALSLFNRASYYPLALLACFVIGLLFK